MFYINPLFKRVNEFLTFSLFYFYFFCYNENRKGYLAMEKVDFSQCRFIKEEMWFYTYADFCQHHKSLKRLFNTLDSNGKLFYMWYVYANINMGEMYKNRIWDYLNNDDVQYEISLMQLGKKSK